MKPKNEYILTSMYAVHTTHETTIGPFLNKKRKCKNKLPKLATRTVIQKYKKS